MKSSPKIEFISLVILFQTIFKDANDSYHPSLSCILSKLLPHNSISCLTLSRSPSFAADSSGFILDWPIDCGTLLLLVVGYEQHLKIRLARSKMLSPRAHGSVKNLKS